MTGFTRSLFNATFKTNPALERAIMTGITRTGKESIFSDLNNLEVVTTTSGKYTHAFGFTETEVYDALEEYHLSDRKDDVKRWYDGFVFGKERDIYNPWSILNFIDTGVLQHLFTPIDEQIVYNQLDGNAAAIWSLLLAITNYEVQVMFYGMVSSWFVQAEDDYNDFIKALLKCDVREMNLYMNQVAMTVFSYFDTGKGNSISQPERFYHGFVLGLLVELSDRYILTSNRESGFGRYDVMLEPRNIEENAYILEFKVHDAVEETSLQDSVACIYAM